VILCWVAEWIIKQYGDDFMKQLISNVAVDYVATKIMGFDYKKIKTMKNALEMKKYPFGINDASMINIVGDELDDLHFSPAYNWRGNIENCNSD